ncbi:hypothetical protein LTR70_009364 [Exophiala xenobiotica]|uniref:RING-type domain-containing protein n=1 Tax=Lithohypha guttulata TaxID=1690604 RepID=A0ABR0K0I2_9EURO|nr:hypothetical protein LTR24_008277 [Lithohypha guttulata]KAK5310599.1 hypothetical protein LTR70_009364 [Exophiala xenobiotica]
MATTPEATPGTREYEELYAKQHHTFAKVRLTHGHPLREDQEDCSICLEPITNLQETLTHDTCKHSWHDECLNQWFREDKQHCPLDREKLRYHPAISYSVFVSHVCFEYIGRVLNLDDDWVQWAARTIAVYRLELSELRKEVAEDLGQQPNDSAVETVIIAELSQAVTHRLDKEPDEEIAKYMANALGQVTAMLAEVFAFLDMDDFARDLELFRHVLAALPILGPLCPECDSNRGEVVETGGTPDDISREDDILPPLWQS